MKLTDKAQKTLDALFASGDGKHSAGGVVFGTTVIYNAGRANGMKYRTIKETFMSDALKVGYGKYDLYSLKTNPVTEIAEQAAPQPSLARAAKKVGDKKPEMSKKEKYAAMLAASANWEVVYDSATDESLNS
jgi:hypothetical protein